MNELGAELDRARGVSGCDREDAAAYAIAGFEDFDINASLMQRTGCSQAGGTGTDDYDHQVTLALTMDDGRWTDLLTN